MSMPAETPEIGLGLGLPPALREEIKHELQHLRDHWWWLLVLGVLLVVSGTLAIVIPAATTLTTFVALVALGFTMMVAGTAILVSSFWVGKWSGFFLQALVGILYLVGGFMIAEQPLKIAVLATMLLAALFITLGAFRVIAALVYRFHQWGWILLNGAVTLLMGVIIYRHLPKDCAVGDRPLGGH